MLPQEIIRKKRDGAPLTVEEMKEFFQSFLRDRIPDYQMAALLMAVNFSGMTFEETIALTQIYLESGKRLDLSTIPGPKIDKHSTGGVGDKTSLLLAPICAAAGVNVPMISGRGLAHTGGTLDKLESIPGFRANINETEYFWALRNTGMAMMGQTDSIVPLDKKIYSLRDVTATVEILPLIGASIMSKKIAGGADALVLDVKTGTGAFMNSELTASELAKLLVEIGEHFGLRTVGFLTKMDEPLGLAIGNWIEIVEVVDCLKGNPTPDLMEVTNVLAGAMIHLGNKARSIMEGITIAEEMLQNGLAYRKFLELVEIQGGDARYIQDTLLYPPAKTIAEVNAEKSGYVSVVNARKLGLLNIELGGGRKVMTDEIDPTAGIILMKKSGDEVQEGEPLCRLYSSVHPFLAAFREKALDAFSIVPFPQRKESKVLSYFDRNGFVDWYEYQKQMS